MWARRTFNFVAAAILVTGCGQARILTSRRVSSVSSDNQTAQSDISGKQGTATASPEAVKEAPIILSTIPEATYLAEERRWRDQLITKTLKAQADPSSVVLDVRWDGGTVTRGSTFPASPILCADSVTFPSSGLAAGARPDILKQMTEQLGTLGLKIVPAVEGIPVVQVWLAPDLRVTGCANSGKQSLGTWNEQALIPDQIIFIASLQTSEKIVADMASLVLAARGKVATSHLISDYYPISTSLAAPASLLVTPPSGNFLQLSRLTPQLDLASALTSLSLPSVIKKWFDDRETLRGGDALKRSQIIPTLMVINYLGLGQKDNFTETSPSSWSQLTNPSIMTTVASQVNSLAQDWLDKPFGGILQSLVFPLNLGSLREAMGRDPDQNLPNYFLADTLQLKNWQDPKQRLLSAKFLWAEGQKNCKKTAEQEAARQILLWSLFDATVTSTNTQ